MQVNKHMKRCSTYMSSGKCKLKRDTTTHLWEQPKPKIMTTPHTGKDMEKEISFTADENTKW